MNKVHRLKERSTSSNFQAEEGAMSADRYPSAATSSWALSRTRCNVIDSSDEEVWDGGPNKAITRATERCRLTKEQ